MPETAPEFSSSLDPRETPRGTIRHPLAPIVPDENRDEVLTFRHSFWKNKRPAVRRALAGAGASTNTLARFDNCGCNCWVLSAHENGSAAAGTPSGPGTQRNITDLPGGKRFRLASDRCRNRWCEACSVEKRRTICRNLLTQLCERYELPTPYRPCDRVRFLTLTLKSSDKPLKEQITRLYACFAQFRKRRPIRDKLTGGLAFLELTRNTTTGQWHPHLHILFEGAFLPVALARKEWLAVTADSFIVDVRRIRTVAEAAGYVAKYASKSCGAHVWQHPEAMQEAVTALAGRRSFNAFGTWKKLSLSRPPADDLDWSPVCTLREMLARARAGEPEAIEILRSLRGAGAHEPLDGQIHPSTGPPMPNLPL